MPIILTIHVFGLTVTVSAFIGSPPIKISEFSAIYEYILYK